VEYGRLFLNDVWVIRLDRGEDLLQRLNMIVKQSKIEQGFIISGLGVLDQVRGYVCKTGTIPPEREIFQIEELSELTSLDGTISEGQVHAHFTFTTKNGRSMGGHLLEGSRVLFFAEIAILSLSGGMLTKEIKPGKPKLLRIIESIKKAN